MKFIITSLLAFSLQVHSGIFDKPENLKLLDKNISPENLSKVMKNFSRSLGVRCQHCHVGEEGKSLSTFDFASDDKQNKKTARKMMEMVSDIQKNYINKINDNSVKMECMSCHRGNNTPKLTKDILMTAYNEGDADDVLVKYNELKEKYYGTHSHDFSEGILLAVVSMIGDSDTDSVLQLLHFNLSIHPKSGQTLWMLAKTFQSINDNDKAIEYYKRVNDIRPNPRIQKILEDLQKTKE